MKAAIYTKSRSGKVLEIRELEKPVPKDNDVLLRVRAASVNPLDWRMKRQRPGVDVAGVVEAVGRRVTRFKPGDAVFGTCKGAFAEFACAGETKLVLKPENFPFEHAAAAPIAGLTALQALRDAGHVQSGQSVLINGAAGGVGTSAVQIAKSFGASVTGVCSARNVEMVRSLGADRIIDYTRDDFTQGGARYDLLLDHVGNRPLSALRRILAPNGTCVMVGAPKELWAVITRLLETFARSLVLRQKFPFFIAKVNRDELAALLELMVAGKMTPVIDKRYRLGETADAIACVEEGHARAKVVISFE